jgi:lactoylglutathione lyase
MLIEHVAIWVKDIEKMKLFYEKYFHCSSDKKYQNEIKNFESYFLCFENGARLELMRRPDIPGNLNNARDQYRGIIHIAIKIGNKDGVDKLTEKLRNDGYIVLEEPRKTGDGYYKSCILDPENNRIEIVA